MTIINQINKYLKIIIQIYSLIIKLISNKYNLDLSNYKVRVESAFKSGAIKKGKYKK